jgi:DNA excision repair protein ERCC-3
MGLSGSPYREDGRVNYIIALTGFPIGLAWEKFFELGIIKKPTITLFVVSQLKDKLRKLDELLQKELGKTLIFCDSIALGEKLARQHNLDFIHGGTTKRLEKIRENERVIVSRVGDEGLSLPEMDTLVEVDFLFGSRMQQSQRTGRLLHSKKKATNHYILMTEEELEKYGKRLLALYEKGFRINIVR